MTSCTTHICPAGSRYTISASCRDRTYSRSRSCTLQEITDDDGLEALIVSSLLFLLQRSLDHNHVSCHLTRQTNRAIRIRLPGSVLLIPYRRMLSFRANVTTNQRRLLNCKIVRHKLMKQ